MKPILTQKEKLKNKANWPTKKLGEVCLKITDGSHAPPQEIENGEMMLSSRNIYDTGIIYINYRKISKADFEEENRRTEVSAGDVLFTCVGSIGRCVVVPSDAPKFTLQRSVAVIKPKGGLDSKYLAYCLKSPFIQRKVSQNARGGAQQGIYLKDIKDIEIPLPPLQIQKKIVKKIEELFAKITQAQSLRESAIQDTNNLIPVYLRQVFDGAKTRSWPMILVGDVCEIKGGKRLPGGHKITRTKTRHPYLRVADFVLYGIEQSDIRYIEQNTFEQISRYTISKTDVFISIAGTIGVTGVIPESFDGANLTENAAKLTSLKNINQRYLMYMLTSEQVKDQIRGEAIQTTISKLGLFRIARLKIPLPPMAEQIKIVERLDELTQKVRELQTLQSQTASDLTALKQSILYKAFQGEL